jgi:hypothetical protein
MHGQNMEWGTTDETETTMGRIAPKNDKRNIWGGRTKMKHRLATVCVCMRSEGNARVRGNIV